MVTARVRSEGPPLNKVWTPARGSFAEDDLLVESWHGIGDSAFLRINTGTSAGSDCFLLELPEAVVTSGADIIICV